MPRVLTERQTRLKGLVTAVILRELLALDDKEPTIEEQEEEMLLDLAAYYEILNTRYSVQRTRIPHSGTLHVLWDYARSPEHHHRFTRLVRVSPATFQRILGEIEANPIFLNSSSHPQAPVELQLAVALYRLGRYGNGVSMDDVAFIAGIGHGTTTLYTKRVISALLDVHGRWIRPLTAEERARERQWVLERVGCPEFVPGIYQYDGTCGELWQKPGLNGDAYFNRCMYYGINIQVGCIASNLRVVDYSVGHTGAAHDSLAFKSTGAYLYPEMMFHDDEFAWADSAYTASHHIIPIHKAPANNDPRIQAFDKAVSSLRVRVEHCIGLIKIRFQSLRGIRININRQRQHIAAMNWATACLILHNICVEVGDDTWDVEEEPVELLNLRPDAVEEDEAEGGARRQQLVDAYNHWRYGI